MKRVMTKAVKIAKGLEGDWVARMKMALKMAWVIIKKESIQAINGTIFEVAELIKERLAEKGIYHKVNVWENYGKRRIYVNKSFKHQIAMLEFDQDDNYIGGYEEMDPMDLFAANQNGVRDEIDIIQEIRKGLVA